MKNLKDIPSRTPWRQTTGAPPLAEVFASIPVLGVTKLRRFLSFAGPGFLVAVGYMDPGNWATSLAGGSKYGYALLSIVLLSSLMAIVLQALCIRLGIATGRDLAQACRDSVSKPAAFMLWILAEAAICATDLAEVIGTAIALQLLFHIPLQLAVLLTALDVFLILALQRLGFRWIEAFVIALLFIIALCFGVQLFMARPEWAGIFGGFVPTARIVTDPGMLYLALGILGATVMPHNLYLHSAIVQTRAIGPSPEEKREAIRYATLDSTLALIFALVINAGILILAAAAFHTNGRTDIVELQDAHALLSPLLGAPLAATLFAVALLCCGLNSAATTTLAGQVVMEGFINLKMPAWARRLTTRIIAILPAIVVTLAYEEGGLSHLLILSQVILSLQLSFAVIPLVLITGSRAKMGALTAPRWISVLGGAIALLIVTLNLRFIVDFIGNIPF